MKVIGAEYNAHPLQVRGKPGECIIWPIYRKYDWLWPPLGTWQISGCPQRAFSLDFQCNNNIWHWDQHWLSRQHHQVEYTHWRAQPVFFVNMHQGTCETCFEMLKVSVTQLWAEPFIWLTARWLPQLMNQHVVPYHAVMKIMGLQVPLYPT